MNRRSAVLRSLLSLSWLACALVAASGISCAGRASSPASSSIAMPAGPLARLEQSLVFAPLKHPEGRWFPPDGLTVEDATFAASGGPRLHGWFCPCENSRAVVLYCHGNSGNLTYCVDVLRELRELGASALIFDYRGYGKSEGTPDEAGILADARAARRGSRTGPA